VGDLGLESLLTAGRVLAPSGALALVVALARADALPLVSGVVPGLNPFRFRACLALKFLLLALRSGPLPKREAPSTVAVPLALDRLLDLHGTLARADALPLVSGLRSGPPPKREAPSTVVVPLALDHLLDLRGTLARADALPLVSGVVPGLNPFRFRACLALKFLLLALRSGPLPKQEAPSTVAVPLTLDHLLDLGGTLALRTRRILRGSTTALTGLHQTGIN
jgi:hypothetical protein